MVGLHYSEIPHFKNWIYGLATNSLQLYLTIVWIQVIWIYKSVKTEGCYLKSHLELCSLFSSHYFQGRHHQPAAFIILDVSTNLSGHSRVSVTVQVVILQMIHIGWLSTLNSLMQMIQYVTGKRDDVFKELPVFERTLPSQVRCVWHYCVPPHSQFLPEKVRWSS